MDITFLIMFGLLVLSTNAIIKWFSNAGKTEFAKGENKKMMQKTVALDEFLNERGDFIKQVVYKIDGDYVGDIKGENVTVILMGNGDINGNISSKDGEVVLIKGDINGDVEADKIVCSKEPVKSCNYCEYFNGYSCAIFNVRPKKVCSCYR